LPLAARFADEWNAIFLSVEEFKKLNARLDALLKQQNRPPEAVRRSMMLGCIFAPERETLLAKLRARRAGIEDLEALRAKGYLVGNAHEIREQLKEYQSSGLQGVMIQWLDLDDLASLERLAKGIIPL